MIKAPKHNPNDNAACAPPGQNGRQPSSTNNGSQDNQLMPIRYFRQAYYLFGNTPEARKAILYNTGITPQSLDDGEAMIEIHAQIRQLNNLRKLMGDGFALQAKAVWQPASQGALDLAFQTSPTIADGLNTIVHYSWLRLPFIDSHIKSSANGITLDLKPTISISQEDWRVLMELAFLGIQAMIAKVLPDQQSEIPLTTIEYSWPYAPPSYVTEYESAFLGRHHFNKEYCQIFFPKSLIQLPSPFADKALLRAASATLKEDTQNVLSKTSITDQVHALLNRDDGPGSIIYKDAENIASTLKISTRTLVRRLSRQGTTFRKIRDDVLKSKAQKLILETSKSREDIAQELGYNDGASLSRSCHRWFGISFRAYRSRGTQT